MILDVFAVVFMSENVPNMRCLSFNKSYIYIYNYFFQCLLILQLYKKKEMGTILIIIKKIQKKQQLFFVLMWWWYYCSSVGFSFRKQHKGCLGVIILILIHNIDNDTSCNYLVLIKFNTNETSTYLSTEINSFRSKKRPLFSCTEWAYSCMLVCQTYLKKSIILLLNKTYFTNFRHAKNF